MGYNLVDCIAVRNDKTVYRDGDAVIKVFGKSYSDSAVLNEALLHSRVESLGLKVPHLREVCKIDGKWAICMDYIDGERLSCKIDADKEGKDKYVDLFVSLQSDVLSRRMPNLVMLKDKLNRKICDADLDATVRYFLHGLLEKVPKKAVLCHGDFVPENIVIGKNGEAYIMDWSHAAQGNEEADVARTYILLNLNGKTDFAESYLEKYVLKSGKEIEVIKKWLPIVAASMLSDYAEQGNELKKWIKFTD